MRSIQAHLEQADRYADAVLNEMQRLAADQDAVNTHRELPMSRDTVALSELMLHAAEVELKLAGAKKYG